MESNIFQYVVLCTAALAVSGLTLFSGFGLGTLLMPGNFHETFSAKNIDKGIGLFKTIPLSVLTYD